MADVQPSDFPLIRRWLKAGILEDEELHPNEEGTPQKGSISVEWACESRTTSTGSNPSQRNGMPDRRFIPKLKGPNIGSTRL